MEVGQDIPQGWKGMTGIGITPQAIAVHLIIDILGGIFPLIGNRITMGVIGICISVEGTMADPHHMINLSIFQPKIIGVRLVRPMGDPIVTILITGEAPYILTLT